MTIWGHEDLRILLDGARRGQSLLQMAQGQDSDGVTGADCDLALWAKFGRSIPEALDILWRGRVKSSPQPTKTMERIALEVALEHGLGLSDLKGRSKPRKIAHPRQFAMWRCMEETDNSSTAVGRFFGGRDHSTVLHAVKAVERRRACS